MNALAIVDRLPRWIMAGIVLAMIAILVVGSSYYRASRARAELVAEQTLTAVARLKVFSIQEWRRETLDDAANLAREPGLRGLLAPGEAVPSAARSNEAAAILSIPLAHQHYLSARLVNASGGVPIDCGGPAGPLQTAELDAVRAALRTSEPALSLLFLDTGIQRPRLSVAAPVAGVTRGDDSASHAVLLGIDPESYLYTLIEMLPLKSWSMETVLFRREGDSVQILNEVRFQADTAVRLNLPLARTNVSYVMGALGSRGVVRAVDYRGVPVLGCLTSVPDSPWLLSSEMDLEEIFGEWNKRARLIVATIVLMLLGLAVSGLAVWQWSKRSSFERLYRAEAGLRASEARAGAIVQSIGDAIVTADTDGVVTLLNPVAEALTGWTATEARGRWMTDIFRLVDEKDGAALPCKVPSVLRNGESQAVADRALLVARDGTKRPVSGSVSAIREGAGVIAGVVLVFRDETRDREAQRALSEAFGALRESEKQLRLLTENATDLIFMLDLTTERYLYGSPAVERMLGCTPDEFVAKTIADVVAPEALAGLREHIARRVAAFTAGDESARDVTLELPLVHNDGSVFVAELSTSLRVDERGQPTLAQGVVRDITERRRAEQQIRDTLARFNEAQKAAHIGSWESSRINGTIWWSEEILRILEFDGSPQFQPTREDFWVRRVHPEDRDRLRAEFEAGLAAHAPIRIQGRLLFPDGRTKHFEMLGDAEYGADGSATHTRGTIQDITDRRKAELQVLEASAKLEEANRLLEQRVEERTVQLAESRQQLLRVLDSMNDVFFTLDTEWRFVVLNRRAEQHFGSTKKNMIGRCFWEVVPAAVGTPIERMMRQTMREQKPAATEMASAVKPGTFISLHAYPTPTELSVFAADVTTRKQAAEEILKLSRIIDQTPFPVLLTNTDATLVYTNQGFTAVTGYPQAEALGRNPRFLQSGVHPPEFYRQMWATLTSGQVWRGELCNRRKTGEVYWEAATIIPVRNSEGRVVNYAAIKEDITQAKRIAKELVDAKEAAEVANRTKSEFLSNMSHELRTPLNAVIGFSEILADQTFGALNAKQTKYMENILQAGRHLLSLINDILDVSKVEAGKMTLAPQILQVKKTVDEVMELTRGRATKHHLRMIRAVPEGLHVAADERMFKQILFNLLSNAIKFTPDGGRVMVTAEPMGPDVRISVADTGIGISQENQKRLFQEFEQIDSSLSRKHQGTGLGLSLCRRFAALHGGRIWVESAGEGCGSVFHFTLPMDMDRISKKEQS